MSKRTDTERLDFMIHTMASIQRCPGCPSVLFWWSTRKRGWIETRIKTIPRATIDEAMDANKAPEQNTSE